MKRKIILILILIILVTGVSSLGRYIYVRIRFEQSQKAIINAMENNNPVSKLKEEENFQIKYKVKPIGILEIPSIKVKNGIIKGVSESDMFWGVGWYPNSPLPNMKSEFTGNLYLAGHDQGYAPIFENLKELRNNDLVYVFINGNTYIYSVYNKFIINPYDTWVMENQPNKSMVTLQTCNRAGNKRWIIQAKLIDRFKGTELMKNDKDKPIRDFNNGEDKEYLKALKEGKVNSEGQII